MICNHRHGRKTKMCQPCQNAYRFDKAARRTYDALVQLVREGRDFSLTALRKITHSEHTQIVRYMDGLVARGQITFVIEDGIIKAVDVIGVGMLKAHVKAVQSHKPTMAARQKLPQSEEFEPRRYEAERRYAQWRADCLARELKPGQRVERKRDFMDAATIEALSGGTMRSLGR